MTTRHRLTLMTTCRSDMTGALSKHHKFGRVKEKYNPIPNARERAFHIYLIDNELCVCGCGRKAECVHHPLQRHPEQRWRRDHEFVVPMADECHRSLHASGNERSWVDGRGIGHLPLLAAGYRVQGIYAGIL